MKAVSIKDSASLRRLRAFREVDLHLLDAHSPDVRGGSGRTFDWELASLHDNRIPMVLSGGIAPDNVGDAIAAVHPYAVDSASGTESEPGVKDPAKVEGLIGAVRAADAARVA
jgi:phosphoribosylanthranilate isomerase